MERLQRVELDDGTPPPMQEAPRRRSRRRWLWAAAGVVVAAGALVAGQTVVDARHAARLARFDHVPGVVAPPTHDVAPLWTVEGDPSGVVRAGDVLVQPSADGGTARAVGLAPATGRTLWSTALDAPAGAGVDVRCRPLAAVDGGAADRVACVVRATAEEVPVADGPARVAVLDAGTGRELARWQTPVAVWAVSVDRIVAGAVTGDRADRTWTLTAFTPDGGTAWTRTARWATQTLAAGDPSLDGLPAGDEPPRAALAADADRVLLSADGHGVLLDAHGEVVRSLDGGASWVLGRAGTLVKGRLVDTAFSLRGEPVMLEGSVDAAGLPAQTAVTLAVDDGSVPRTVLAASRDGYLAAYDTRTGRELWRSTVTTQPQVLLGGRLYASTGYRVVALDAATGRELWNRPLDGRKPFRFTDGRAIYVSGSDDTITAYALDDGAPGEVLRLRSPADNGPTADLEAWNGVLAYVASDRTTTVMG